MAVLNSAVRRSPEFQSAVIRLTVWTVMVVVLGLGGAAGHFDLAWTLFYALFGMHLAWFLVLLIDTVRRPALLPRRTYVAIVSDLSGTSCTIYLAGDPVGPFFLIYILSFLSQGTRYGVANLRVVSAGSVVAYIAVVLLLGGWGGREIEVVMVVAALVAIPLYQNNLLHKLQASRDDADHANRARGTFLTSVTRELDKPACAIDTHLRRLRETTLSREQRQELDSVNESTRALHGLIDGIVDLSRVDAGTLVLEDRRFDIRQCVVGLCRQFSDLALDKGLEVVCSFAPEVPLRVRGDEARLCQVLHSLVGNALAFTGRGHVLVRVTPGASALLGGVRHLRIEVEDTGSGLSAAVHAELTRSFAQQDSTGTRRFGGAGLGTTLARDLVHMMGGNISVANGSSGGACFCLELPLLRDDPGFIPAAPGGLAGRAVCIYDEDALAADVTCKACAAAAMHCTHVGGATSLARYGGLDADVLVFADSPRGQDLEGLASMLRRLAGSEVPVLFLQYPRRGVSILERDTSSVAKPIDPVELWQALAGLLGRQGGQGS